MSRNTNIIGVVMLTSTPALAAQAIRSVKLTTPPGVTLAWGLGLYKVALSETDGLPDVDLAIHFDEPEFSFSRFNNIMAAKLCARYVSAGGLDFLLFINDDIAARPDSNWLGAMILAHTWAGASEVGIKLVYPEDRVAPGKIQHCGHYRGHGGTGTHRGLYADPDAPQFSKPAWVPTWAVTGAVVLVTPADFWKVGGFDEGYRTLWQDVDLSLALRRTTGRPVVCVQDEWLYHFEGATQGGRFDEEPWWLTRPDVQEDRDRFIKKWPPSEDGAL